MTHTNSITRIRLTGWILLLCTLLPISIRAASQQTISITASANQQMAIQLLSTPTVSIGTAIIPNHSFIDTPNIRPTDTDPWQIVSPIKVSVHLTNNVGNVNLFAYTDHRNRPYFTTTANARITPTSNLNGLVNIDLVSSRNISGTTASLRAWVDHTTGGTVTTNASANWVWILDQAANKQPLCQTHQRYLDQPIDIYIRSCWNHPKLAGTYRADILFLLDTE